MRHFVIAAQERCGTHMLRTGLIKNPDIQCTHEVFNTDVYSRLKKQCLDDPKETPWEGQPVVEFLDQIPKTSNIEGVIIQPHHFQKRPTGYGELVAMKPKTIILYRHNTFRQYLSYKQAFARSKWEHYEGQRVAPLNPISIDMPSYWRYHTIRRQCFMQNLIDFPNNLVVAYEQLISDWPHHMTRICTFLGAGYYINEPDTLKVGRPPSECVSNWNDCKESLKQRGFGDFCT